LGEFGTNNHEFPKSKAFSQQAVIDEKQKAKPKKIYKIKHYV
jgi:hypothetical protein